MGVKEVDIDRIAQQGTHQTGGNHSQLVVWNVEVDDAADGSEEILRYFAATLNLPYLGDHYDLTTHGAPGELDQDLFCNNIQTRRKDKSQTEWSVTTTYGPITAQTGIQEDGTPTQRPTLRRREFRLGFAPRQVIAERGLYYGVWEYVDPAGGWREEVFPTSGIYQDITPEGAGAEGYGRPMIPSASSGTVFRPGAFKDVSDTILMIRVPLLLGAVNPAELSEAVDAVNDDHIKLDLAGTIYAPFLWEIPKWHLKLVSIDTTFVTESYKSDTGLTVIEHYWDTTYEFHYRRGTKVLGVTNAVMADHFPKNTMGWVENYPDMSQSAAAFVGDPDGAGGTIPEDPAGIPGQSYHRRITDTYGNPSGEEALDGNGQPLREVDWTSPTLTTLKSKKLISFLNLDQYDFLTLSGPGFEAWNPSS